MGIDPKKLRLIIEGLIIGEYKRETGMRGNDSKLLDWIRLVFAPSFATRWDSELGSVIDGELQKEGCVYIDTNNHTYCIYSVNGTVNFKEVKKADHEPYKFPLP